MSDSVTERFKATDAEEPPKTDMPSPDSTSPMLATLTEDYFDDPDWIYERKLDGERALAFVRDGSATLRSRNHNVLDETYPELVDALAATGSELVADGEIVAFDGDVTSFQRLQGRMNVSDADQARASGIAVKFYLFDVLWLDGYDVTDLPLRDRKALLREAIDFEDPLRFTTHRNEEGIRYREEACEKGWEGVIAKDATSAYVHSRSKKWLKFKCVARQELVIGGFTEPQGDRVGFGALLVGFYEDDQLHYAGKVGTGYSDDFLEEFRERLDELETDQSPFDAGDPNEDAHFVEPKLVAEIGFTEWTNAGRLRHPRFIGIRRDKEPGDVVRERPQ